MAVIDFGFLASFVCVVIIALISKYKKLDFEKELLVSSLKAFVQVMLLGFILLYILKSENLLVMVSMVAIMLLFATYTSTNRISTKIVPFYKSFLALSGSTVITLVFLVLLGALPLKNEVLIPICGMVIGNSLNTYTLCVDRLKSELLSQSHIIEAKVSLGESFESALRPELKKSIKSSMMPIINNLQTLGIVFIPGAMTGMVIAGANPMEAASYQLIIMYMIAATSFLSAFFGTYLNYRYIFINRYVIDFRTQIK